VTIFRNIPWPTSWSGPVTAILLVLVPWLWWHGMHTGADHADDALRALDDLTIAKGALYRDVLSSRTRGS
jgi:hypothetical protein